MEGGGSVVVIGAGISGVCSAAHLLKQGLSVTLYERSSVAGGVWHFDERSAIDPAYPNEVASRGDYDRVSFEDEDACMTPPVTPKETIRSNLDESHGLSVKTSELDVELARLKHAPPGPCYAGLKNNVGLTLMKTSLADWPAGLEEYVNQQYLERYIQSIAQQHRVNEVTRYNTRVEEVTKIGDKWRVRTTSPDVQNGSLQLLKQTNFFEAVVVASGHYHMPRIPDIRGLKEWKALFPHRIQHSKGYRHAKAYQDSNVLIIGAGVSSSDIAKEVVQAGGNVWQSSRGGSFDLPASTLPEKARRIAGISSFTLDGVSSEDIPESAALNNDLPLPGRVILTDGTELRDLHCVILATGYITSYPFLEDKHSDHKARHEANNHILITKEGDMVHNLHKDIFYLEDPSLAFVGVPYHISTFSLFDFQAQVVARVFDGTVKLPAYQTMRAEYDERVCRRGLGRGFHSLRATGAEIRYVRDLVEMVNQGRTAATEPMIGHTETWLAAHRIQREQLAQRFGGSLDEWLPK